MTHGLELDVETESDIDLLKRGAYVYFESPHTDVKLLSYRLNGGPWKRWRRGQPCPSEIVEHVESGGMISAHNAGFERLAWWNCLTPKHGWPRPRIEQFRCVAATAAAMSLPRSLDRFGAALQLNVQKDKKGKALIKRYSLPAEYVDGKPVFRNDPEGIEEFHKYCDIDVQTEAEADRRLIPFSDYEQAVYTLNEKINDRGIRLDIKSALAAIALAERAKKKLDGEMVEATGGYVRACTNVKDLKDWIGSQGVACETVGKDDLEELLELEDLPERVRRALEIRLEAAKTSVSKIQSMIDRVCKDGRMRGLYLHHGAGQTGRFSSRGVQLHNPPRPRKEFEDAKPDLKTLFDVIRSADPAMVEWMYGPKLGRPLHLLSDSIRSFLWAAPGHEFVNADYSSIEGRMSAWFAGEEWKLDAFRALDRGEGHGIYELLAADIFGVPVEKVDKIQRQGGKVGELSMGYQGGVGALSRMARANKIKLPNIFDAVWASASDERREGAEGRYAERLEKNDEAALKLGRKGWIAAELIKLGWRAKHPNIAEAWKLLEEAAVGAVLEPGRTYHAIGVSYRVAHGFLWCKLPSGRCLAYGAPRYGDVEAPWADKTLPPEQREKKKSVTVMGVDSQTEKWVRFPIYGGSLFNNVVQGSARDILVHGMFLAESAGYPIVLHTHDEMMSELPRGVGDAKEFERIICQLPAWAAGLPLTADGWVSKRYHK